MQRKLALRVVDSSSREKCKRRERPRRHFCGATMFCRRSDFDEAVASLASGSDGRRAVTWSACLPAVSTRVVAAMSSSGSFSFFLVFLGS